MPRISLAFFTVAALCGLAGMIWGAIMGATGDHGMMPAHAHLNLLGWVTLSIMGGFYALRGGPGGRLGWANFAFSAFGALATAPMLFWLLSGHEKQIGPLMPINEVPTILGMVLFIASVAMSWRKTAA
jgi:hypothetical protein